MNSTGWRRVRWGIYGILLCMSLRGAAPGGAPAPDPLNALKEMATLEAQIEQAQRQQFEEQRRVLEASRSLNALDSTLKQKDLLNQEGEAFLQQYDARTQSGLATVEQQLAGQQRKAASARSGLALTGTLLLAEKRGRASGDAGLLALGMLHDLHRRRANMASQEIQDLEARRTDLEGKRDHAQRSAEYQTVFSQFSLQQLRERHQELARQVSEAQAQSDEQTQQVRELASRREELKSLIARLAEQEAHRAAEPTPTPVPTATPAPAVTPAPSLEPPHPALPSLGEGSGNTAPGFTPTPAVTGRTNASASASATEVPYEEGSEPMASAMRASEDKDQTDASGTRYLFWRARPVGVRALGDGKVIFSGSFAGYRHLLIVDHGGGWLSLYGNMISTPLAIGSHVDKDMVVGEYQAVQGSRAEPLWYEVRRGTQAMAPESWPAMPPQWQSHILSPLREEAAK